MRKLPKETIAYIIAHFPNTENIAIANKVGCSLSAVNRIQHRYNLKKTKEHLHKQYSNAGKKGMAIYGTPPITDEAIRRRADTYKKLYQEEKARCVFGLPKKTNIKVRREPILKQSQRTYLRSLGYIIDRENNIAYWTPETKRAVRMEAYTKKRSYYKFLSYDEHQ